MRSKQFLQIPPFESSVYANNRIASKWKGHAFKIAEALLAELRALDQEKKTLRRAYRAALNETLAAVCACASRFAESENLFAAFVANEFWTENPKQAPGPGDRKNALKFVLRWHCGSGWVASKRASRYWLALRTLGDLGADTRAWANAIVEAGGISKMKPDLPRAKPLASEPISANSVPWDDDGPTSVSPGQPSKLPIAMGSHILSLLVDEIPMGKLLSLERGTNVSLKVEVIAAGKVAFRVIGFEIE